MRNQKWLMGWVLRCSDSVGIARKDGREDMMEGSRN
jgi:hypothetical protein